MSSNCSLKEVRGIIYESDGITIKYKKSVFPFSKNYDIQKGGEIGKELLFSNLSVGTYYYTIVAKNILGTEKTLVNDKFEVKAKRKVLPIDKKLISRVGSMGEGEQTCGAQWTGGYSKNPTNDKEALRLVYDSINKGKPCVLRVTQKQKPKGQDGRHYIMIYGYTNVSNPNNMTAKNLVFIDPFAFKGQQYYDGNVGNIEKIGIAGKQQVILY